MKKALSTLLAVAMLAIPFSLTVSASNFVPSITAKAAPRMVTEAYMGKLLITPVSEAETSTEIPEDARDLLLEVYDVLSDPDTELASLSDELNEQVAEELGAGRNANALIVKDLFDVTVLDDELEESLEGEGTTIDVTFELNNIAGQYVVVMSYKDGEWAPIVETVNNGDNTITCTFEGFCPVAILVPAADEGITPPHTGIDTQMLVWAGVMAVSASLIVALVVVKRRSAKKVESK